MKNILIASVILIACMGTLTAQAEPIPSTVLDRDFMSCMGGKDPKQDAVRNTYCSCIRDGMRGWTLEGYAEIAQQQQKAYSADQVPAAIKEIAEGCVARMKR
ncbi:MAG: hypothetical protein SFW62_01800 [Alphaproteobacteria bacterium]|nr:hypothetical protein [Alphaproteobacteria bacterium]